MINEEKATTPEEERQQIKSANKMREIMAEYYIEAKTANQNGKKVAFTAANCAETVAFILACTSIGTILIPLSTRLTHPEVVYICENAEATALVHSSDDLNCLSPL